MKYLLIFPIENAIYYHKFNNWAAAFEFGWVSGKIFLIKGESICGELKPKTNIIA